MCNKPTCKYKTAIYPRAIHALLFIPMYLQSENSTGYLFNLICCSKTQIYKYTYACNLFYHDAFICYLFLSYLCFCIINNVCILSYLTFCICKYILFTLSALDFCCRNVHISLLLDKEGILIVILRVLTDQMKLHRADRYKSRASIASIDSNELL